MTYGEKHRQVKDELFAESGLCHYCEKPIERIEDAGVLRHFGPLWSGDHLYHRSPCIALSILASAEGGKGRHAGISPAAFRRMRG